MSRTSRGILISLTGILLALGVPRSSDAQSVTVSAGPAGYDLSGDGWSGIGGVHLTSSGEGWVGVEVGTGVFWYRTQGDQAVVMLLPELGARIQAPSVFPAYVGVGLGYSVAMRGDQPNALTVHGAVGFSLALTDDWRIRPEMRLRAVDPFHGTIGGFTIGVTRRLGR